ncbi:MAG: transposase, partial [Ruminococcus bromii]|nr:transposase [Ruminococcus bromii]
MVSLKSRYITSSHDTIRNNECLKQEKRYTRKADQDEVITAMKDMFKDILQEVMECELADELGYEKSERTSNNECSNKSKNYRNGYSKKT